MRGWWGSIIAAAVLALYAAPASAQSGASCPIGAPVTVTATSYVLTNNDQCRALIFTASTPVAVTAPAANTVAPGFQAMLFSITGGVTVTSASSISSSTSGVVIGPGQSGVLYGDGTNYWFGNGSGFASIPPNSAFSAASLGLLQGTTSANSPIITVPNGILKFSNEASFRSGSYPLSVCSNAPIAFGAGATGTPRSMADSKPWLQIFDNLSRPWLIPLCNSNP